MSGIVGNNTNRGSGTVKSAAVGADSIDGSNIADDAIDSEHYTDGSIDNAHIADDAIDSEHYTDGSIDNAHIADDAIDSEHYADGSIDNAHIADDAIDSEHYAAGSIDEAHIANDAVTLAKMAGGTDGNIISYDASGDPVAIATGSDGEVLTSTGAGSPPAFEAAAGGASYKVLAASYDLATASGDQTITGVGFQPVAVIQISSALGGPAGIGFSDASTDGTVFSNHLVVANTWTNNDNLFFARTSTGNQQAGTPTFTSDGMTIAWTKTGSPSGTFYQKFIFFK